MTDEPRELTATQLAHRERVLADGTRFEQLVFEYESGDRITTIADRHGLVYGTMRRYLMACGVRMRPPGRPGSAPRVPAPERPRYSREERDVLADRIVDWYRTRAMGLEQIADATGLTQPTVRLLLVDRGVEISTWDSDDDVLAPGLALDAGQLAELARRYRAGTGIAELAIEHGCTHQRMRDTLMLTGVTIRSIGSAGQGRYRGQQRKQVREEMARLYDDGASTREIGRLYEVCHVTAATMLREAGVKLRGPDERPTRREGRA
ncbi:hypothetical protein [Actinocatenispora comari]|uniref:Helix-turn-helix domain containing protein n=1 Tax=Actinocatenispora comari TaxID=2807577 RepID=A0A8J4ESL6_9ACTN|nr:hypothetical protein [Actinocatenispora comari]GIL32064.1 hypothetical protein NUM_73180 [Actinocatenispora comari]